MIHCKSHYVISIEENNKNYAFAETLSNEVNLKSALFNRYPNAKVIMACTSRSQAEKIALEWNKDYKNNGTYMF